MAATNGNNTHDEVVLPEAIEEGSDFGDSDDWEAELARYWNGPRLTRTAYTLVTMHPGMPPKELVELGDAIPDLRYVRYRIIRVHEGGKEAVTPYGSLMEFFPAVVTGGEDGDEHPGFTPANFEVGVFRHSMVRRLGLSDPNWVLWMKIDNVEGLAFRVQDGKTVWDPAADKNFRDLLEQFDMNYLKKERLTFFALTFIVYVEGPETRAKFLDKFDPNHTTCAASNIPCYMCGSSPDGPTSPCGPHTPSKLAGSPDTGYSLLDTPTSEAWMNDSLASPAADETTVVTIPDEAPSTLIRRGVLASLDTEIKKGDVLDGDMDAILPVTDTPYPAEWDTCCSLLKLNPDEHKDPLVRSVTIPHTGIALSPRQYRSAFWMLSSKEARDIEGGILADVPGTGKTYTCMAVVLLRALIAYNMAEVKREWEMRAYEDKKAAGGKREYQHFPRNYVSGGNDTCPCGDKLGVVCYANPNSQTRLIGDCMNRGVSLIQVPSGVIEEWKKVMSEGKLNRKYFEPCVFHTSVPRDLQPPPDFQKRFELKIAPFKKDYPQKHVAGLYDFSITHKIADDPSKAPERFVLLTTHAADKLTKAFEHKATIVIGGKRQRVGIYGLPVACHMVDEFHAVRGMTGPVVEMARGHIVKNGCDFWSVTGTPLQFNLTDLESTVDLLQRIPWQDKAHANFCKTVDSLQALHEAYGRAVAADACPAMVEEFNDMSRGFFHGLIMRHTMDSRFFDKKITTIKEIKTDKVSLFCDDYAQYKDDIQEIANQVKEKIIELTGVGNGYEQVVRSLKTYHELAPLQMLSAFPAAAKAIKSGDLRCDQISLRKTIAAKENEDNRDPAKMPTFIALTSDIIQDSPLVDRIWYHFQNMELDRNCRPSKDTAGNPLPWGPRDDRKLKKMVIITPTLAEAIFIYLALRRRLAEADNASRVALLHADMKSSAKQAMATDFQSLTPRSARILVTPFDVGGTGINLQTANYTILTGPLRTKELEKQAFARTNREGQYLRLHQWLFLDDDNPAHRLICARQAGRKVKGDPFDLAKELEVEEE